MKIERRAVDGVLLLDKPAGLSSTQAMAAAKRLFRAEKAGHTGTLDPFATGLLPVCFGEATKFARFMLDARKTYRATLRLGATSTTGDTEGEITVSSTAPQPDDVRVREVLAQFLGPQLQTPPMTSALKIDGVHLYKLARQGIEVARDAREITIFGLQLFSLVGGELVIDADVSKGTYIRVLAEDIGRALGMGAYLTALRRTGTGGFDLDNALSLDLLAGKAEADRDGTLLPPEALCGALPRAEVDAADRRIFCNGGWLEWEMPKTSLTKSPEVAVYEGSRFLGVGCIKPHGEHMRLVPERLLSTGTP